MTAEEQPFRLRALHRALADPLRIRLFEHLVVRPRSAKELAEAVGMPPDRLYHHLARLEEAGLIAIAEYRPLPGGKVERVYAPAAVEPPGDEASPADTARFFSAVIEATRADVTSALMARESGQRRDISLTRTGLRLSDADRAELLAAFERLIREAKAKESPDGTWTRVTWTLADAEDRTPQP
jgi:DNA-binding transcriptional ArsR family regulator